MLPRGANARREHEVEQLRLRDLISSVRIHNLVLGAQLTEFWTRIVVELIKHQKRHMSSCKVLAFL